MSKPLASKIYLLKNKKATAKYSAQYMRKGRFELQITDCDNIE